MTITVPEFGIHDHVRKAVEVSGRSVQEFADEIGVSRNTVSRWINGARVPSRAQLMAISIVSGVPLEWLEGGLARPERLELPTFCSVADLDREAAFWAIVEPAHV